MSPYTLFCLFSTRSFFCISFLRDPALAPPPPPPPPLRLNNYPPFDDFALLLSYHILHMQIFIDRKNSEIKRFISSLHVSSSFAREEKEIFFYMSYKPSKFAKFTISYLITFNNFFSLSYTFLIYFNAIIFNSNNRGFIRYCINIRFSGIFQSIYINQRSLFNECKRRFLHSVYNVSFHVDTRPASCSFYSYLFTTATY